jgi:hypothetical protein
MLSFVIVSPADGRHASGKNDAQQEQMYEVRMRMRIIQTPALTEITLNQRLRF